MSDSPEYDAEHMIDVQPRIVLSIVYRAITCPHCGMTFGVPESWRDMRAGDMNTIWCPNGHTTHLRGPEIQLLRQEKARLVGVIDEQDREITRLREAIRNAGDLDDEARNPTQITPHERRS